MFTNLIRRDRFRLRGATRQNQVGAKGSEVQQNHDEGKEGHSHEHANANMHSDNGKEPDGASLLRPDEDGVAQLQETNGNSGKGEK